MNMSASSMAWVTFPIVENLEFSKVQKDFDIEDYQRKH